MKIRWSPLSLERITEIAEDIAEDKPGASLSWIDSIFDSTDKLKLFPEIGRIVPEINRKEIQEIFVGNYRLIYRIEEKSISILTIRHGKQLLVREDLSK